MNPKQTLIKTIKLTAILLSLFLISQTINLKTMNAEAKDPDDIKSDSPVKAAVKCDSEAGEEQVDWQSKSEEYWKQQMTPEQFAVSRKAGTERAFSGKYNKDQRAGAYHCSSCGQVLFASDTKFDSGTGWPSFTDPINTQNVKLIPDHSKGMIRTEVVCSRCNAHLGHVFDDGPSESGNRFCINSLSLVHELDKK